MCGLAGYYRLSGAVSTASEELKDALRAIHHRGPDDWGVWEGDPNVGLGHRRLSILDLSPHGHQPMVSPDGRLIMVFNGEVYNFADIRRDLEAKGCRFRGTGDSEVILAAFGEWGIEAVHRFIGMFAIALWDRREKRLFLLRDRLGVKPLYYGWDGRTLIFGSEIKALRAFRHWHPELDRDALADYFQFGYINAPRSIYRNVLKLPPGHWLELSTSGEPVVRRYWSVLDVVGHPFGATEEELTEELEVLMTDAFKLRMVSDVPVGVFLSGGVDSSLVAAVLQKHSSSRVHTFTIGFEEAKYDESTHARRVAEHLGTQHTERMLETGEAMRILPMWGQLYDEPYADSSGIPTYLVSRIAGEEVKVVLSADGGDELFSGYNVYGDVLSHIARRERLPKPLRAVLASVLPRLPLETLDRLANDLPLPNRLRQEIRETVTRRACRIRDYLTAPSNGDFYEQAFSFWRPSELQQLTGGYRRLRETSDAYPGTMAEQMCLWDLHNYLPGDILTKVDRATMAASIEGREPLLDHRLVEFAFRLPLNLRRGKLGTKHLMRRILYKHVPREMIDRPKMGFGIPLLEWLRGDLGHLISDYLGPPNIKSRNTLDPEMVARTVRAFRRGDDRAVNRVWTLLAFQMWQAQWG